MPDILIHLSEREQEIIERARQHRKRIVGYELTPRKMLACILYEYDEELNIVERDLAFEAGMNSSGQSKTDAA